MTQDLSGISDTKSQRRSRLLESLDIDDSSLDGNNRPSRERSSSYTRTRKFDVTKIRWDGDPCEGFRGFKRGLEGVVHMAQFGYILEDRFVRDYHRYKSLRRGTTHTSKAAAYKLRAHRHLQRHNISDQQFTEDSKTLYGILAQVTALRPTQHVIIDRENSRKDGVIAYYNILKEYDQFGDPARHREQLEAQTHAKFEDSNLQLVDFISKIEDTWGQLTSYGYSIPAPWTRFQRLLVSLTSEDNFDYIKSLENEYNGPNTTKLRGTAV
jgi:hypothetical protein